MKRQNSDNLEAEILKKYEKRGKAKHKNMRVSGSGAKKLARIISKKSGPGLKKAVILALAGMFTAFLPVRAEEVADLNIKVRILPDSSLAIEETVDYDFADANKHGIYRDLPYKYRARGGNFELRIDQLSVADTRGGPIAFTTEKADGNLRVKIGDPDATVTGKQTYVIRYDVRRAINYFSSHDELYWNAIGTGWTVPIRQARVELALPAAAPETGLKAECWTGPEGSGQACVSKRYEYVGEGSLASVVFAHDRLDPGEALTFAVGWPKGLVRQPSAWDQAREIARDNGIVVLPIFTIVALCWLWRRTGRDPRGRGTVIAQYEAPGGLTPAEVGAAYDERADQRDISAEIIALAVAGYLRIERLAGEGIFNTADYRLIRLKEPAVNLPEHQRLLLGGLFKGGPEAKMSDLKENFYASWDKIKDALYKGLVVKGIFAKNPRSVRGWYYAAGGLLLLLSFAAAPVFGPLGIASAAISALAVLAAARFMPARTKAGALVREEILGLREYLKVAEADRIKFHNAPEKEPARFERLLPYAMVLKVEEEWAKQFEGLYQSQPAWYRDANYSNFNALALASHLNGFSSKSVSALSARPSSAAGGGSGLSGGRAGGGFGGGGGGSW